MRNLTQQCLRQKNDKTKLIKESKMKKTNKQRSKLKNGINFIG